MKISMKTADIEVSMDDSNETNRDKMIEMNTITTTRCNDKCILYILKSPTCHKDIGVCGVWRLPTQKDAHAQL
jgi:hypothetical protein